MHTYIYIYICIYVCVHGSVDFRGFGFDVFRLRDLASKSQAEVRPGPSVLSEEKKVSTQITRRQSTSLFS